MKRKKQQLDDAKTTAENKKSIKEIINVKTTLVCFFATAIAIMGLYGSIVGFMGDASSWLKDMHLAYKIVFLFLIAAVTTFFKIIISFVNSTKTLIAKNISLSEECDKYSKSLAEKDAFIEKHSDSICYILEEATNRKRYQEVVSIGTHLSLPLWYTGKYNLRIRIGHMIEFAAAQIGDKRAQALVLIEDIGWTNIRIEKYEIGTDNINRGLAIAKEINDSYLIAQAYRNLADIHLLWVKRESSLNKKKTEAIVSKDYLDDAIGVTLSMGESIEKSELLGNIYYTYSKYHFELGNHEEALEYVDKSLSIYQQHNMLEKQVKLFVLKGKICLSSQNDLLAIDSFQNGLRLAQKYNVNVHIVSNAIELCKLYLRQQNVTLAKQMLNIAGEVVTAINDPIILEEYHNCMEMLNESD